MSAITFRRSGLELAIGDSTGITRLYDLRSPEPIVTKDQGYGFAVQNIIYLESGTRTQGQVAEPKILTADKRIIKLWDPIDGTPFTSVEPAVDLNHGTINLGIAKTKADLTQSNGAKTRACYSRRTKGSSSTPSLSHNWDQVSLRRALFETLLIECTSATVVQLLG